MFEAYGFPGRHFPILQVSPLGLRRIYAILVRPLLVAAVVVVAAEASAVLVIKIRRLPVERPQYTLSANGASFWRDLDPVFGVWHPPNSRYHARTRCFDVWYESNSYGARDVERTRTARGARIIVIGDSFVEGFGVELDSRLSNRLESRTGIEHLNFGTSGYFGPTQYVLLYESMARHFEHDAVTVVLLPSNDFEDDDPEFGKSFHEDRYRPYWVDSDSGFVVEYYNPDALTTRYEIARQVKRAANSYSQLFGLLRYLHAGRAYRKLAWTNRRTDDPVRPSYYYRFEEEGWRRLEHSLRRLVALTGERPLLVVTAPSRTDVRAYLARNSPGGGGTPLTERLEGLAQTTGFELLDLLPTFAAASAAGREVYFSCDPHWNPDGHALAAETILAHSRLYADGVP